MENGYTGVSTNDIATLSLAGRSYGYGGGNFAGDGSAVKEGVRGNRDISLLESVNRTAADQAISDRITDGHQVLNDSITTGNQFLTDRINAQGIDFKFQNISDQLASAERLAFANNATLQREMAANQAATQRELNSNQAATVAQLHAMDIKQTECCCELKAGQAAILANQESARLVDSQQENQALRTQILINNQGRVGNSGN